MFQVAEIHSAGDLETCRLAWEELWLRGRGKRFSGTCSWLQSYCQQKPEQELKVLVISLAGKIMGILPLVKKRIKTRLGTLRVLTYPQDGWGNWSGPVGPNTAATLTAGLRYLAQSPRDWDLLDLIGIDRDRHDLGRTLTAARNIGWPACERVWREIPVIQLEENWTDFLSRKRENVLQYLTEAEDYVRQQGSVQLLRYRSPLSEFCEEQSSVSLELLLGYWRKLLSLSGSSAGSSTGFTPLQLMAEAADAAGQLDVSVCLVNQQPVAASLGFVSQGQVELVKSVVTTSGLSSPQTTAENALTSVFLGELLQEGLLRGDTCYEVNPQCGLADIAGKFWSTGFLNSFRNTIAPWSHVRSSLLVKYHGFKSTPVPRKPAPQSATPSRTPAYAPVGTTAKSTHPASGSAKAPEQVRLKLYTGK